MDANVPKDRMMKYPYTWTAKLQMFPYKYYWKHAWMTKYWCIGLLCTVPIYWKIGRMVNSPENVEKWREIRRKEFSGESH
ncbi:GSCOCG00001694001-RA-CDS [Cotesia congregata]|uniref:Uncharacterized protein n=2 Tax=Cotesia TaxID=32390 RepID=A0A8J2HSL8_COTCN|nr:uncharacterized protein LOC123274608 [Cotesia glomerata]KAH0556602.1 hypothetical protein KQX54_001228 [Cotesia glomerata]CAD6232001.1 GSCOCG00001694001-RA-CDS [Cotesia congregata]CAG5107045.1 Protein of unknown function [Cotesia congregata]